MFTGIIESTGTILSVAPLGTGKLFWLSSTLAGELKVDQSLSHNGVCLTIEEISSGQYRVTAIRETLSKTGLDEWIPGSRVNLERCLMMNGRLDGHLVQGHVDCTATCIKRDAAGGSWEYTFQYPEQFAHLIIEKGSISLNGISLTIFDITNDTFKVGIIPFTFTHTNMNAVLPGTKVNVEFDVIGKYINRLKAFRADVK